jgi:hypothetical protein
MQPQELAGILRTYLCYFRGCELVIVLGAGINRTEAVMLCSPFELQFTRMIIIEFWPSMKFCGMTALPSALVMANS